MKKPSWLPVRLLACFPTSVLFAAGFCCCPLSLAQQANDRLTLKDGKTQIGRIQDEDVDAISFKPTRGGAETKIPWETVASIEYGGAPAEFTRVMENLTRADPQTLLGSLSTLAGDANLRPPLQQQVLYCRAQTLKRLGKFEDALKGYQEILAAFPKSRFLLEVARGVVDCNVASGKAADAAQALDKIVAEAKAASVGPRFLGEVALVRGDLLLAQSKLAEARAAYEAAEKNEGASPELLHGGRLGVARCLQLQGKAAEAEQLFRKLIGEKAPSEVLGGAWTGLAEVLMETGKVRKSSDLMHESLFGFLRSIVQFAPGPGAATDAYERALAGAAACNDLIAETETSNERRQVYARRAQSRREELARLFPTSKYLKSS